MATVEIKSKVIEMLEHFNIKYNINNSGANLVDFDSLHIQLTGKYAESWKRWSNGVSGRNYRDLTLYLSTQGIIDESEAKSYVGSWKEAELKLNSNTGKSLVLEEVEDYDFSQMVTNPDLYKVKEYLEGTRKLSPKIVERIIDLGVLVQDGRNNARFLWKNANNETIGAEVQGTVFDKERFGTRGTIKQILHGSKGFFWITSKDIKDNLSEVQNIVITEAPIDTLSYVELSLKGNKLKEVSGLSLPDATPKTMFIAMSGSESKVDTTINNLNSLFGLDNNKLKSINSIVIATDNDEAGNKVMDKFKALGFTNLKRVVPNMNKEVNGEKIVKDWNDLLKIFKK